MLAAVFDAVIADNDPQAPGWPVVYIATPQGQLSWHIHPEQMSAFEHVDVVAGDDERARFDGHTTQVKYARLARLCRDMAAHP